MSHPATGHLMTSLTGGSDGSVAALLRGRASATPDARFLRWGDRWWSYAEALEEAERVAGFLRQIDAAGGEHRIASYLSNCPEAVWTWFGTQLAGSVYVPLNRSHKGHLLADLLSRSGASVLVTSADGLAELGQLETSGVHHLVVTDADPERASAIETLSFADVRNVAPWSGVTPSPYALASVMYTSGSTGRSKAVLVPHNALARGAVLVAESFELRADDVWHAWPPIFHMMGQLYVMLGSMAAGAGVALVPRFSRSGFWREVCESGATVICGMASVMRLLWTLEDDEYSRANQVRLALVSGAFGDIHRAFEERYKLSIVDCFGMTEAEPATLPVLGRADPGSHGLASPDFEVRIFDEADSELEAGAIGEIVLRPRRASVMFQGYEGDGEATVRVWRNLWFHTGDLGFIDPAGVLHFLDRRIYGIRRLGENISVWEVEELLHTMPGIAAAVAVGIDAAPGEQDVKAILVRAPGAQITEPEVHRWCASEMAKFMVPRYVEFLDELPRLALGKVDRSQLGHAGPGVWDAQAAILDG